MDRLVEKTWSDEDVRKYAGRHLYAALTHAADASVHNGAASGSTTSALFIHGLNEGWFEGIVVCRGVIEDGRVRCVLEVTTAIVRNSATILEAIVA